MLNLAKVSMSMLKSVYFILNDLNLEMFYFCKSFNKSIEGVTNLLIGIFTQVWSYLLNSTTVPKLWSNYLFEKRPNYKHNFAFISYLSYLPDLISK